MSHWWQTLLVAMLVIAAAMYLAVRSWRWLVRRRAGNCDTGCHGCGSARNQQPLISLEMKPPSDKQ